MARLVHTKKMLAMFPEFPDFPPTSATSKEWKEYDEKMEEISEIRDKSMRRLEEEAENTDFVGRILRFPFADGYAQYIIRRRSPFCIEHIPFGDAYQLPEWQLRGFTVEEAERMLNRRFGPKPIYYRKNKGE